MYSSKNCQQKIFFYYFILCVYIEDKKHIYVMWFQVKKKCFFCCIMAYKICILQRKNKKKFFLVKQQATNLVGLDEFCWVFASYSITQQRNLFSSRCDRFLFELKTFFCIELNIERKYFCLFKFWLFGESRRFPFELFIDKLISNFCKTFFMKNFY